MRLPEEGGKRLPTRSVDQETNDALRKTKVVASLGPASWSEDRSS